MNDGFKKAWSDLVQPLLRRPRRLQVAALCYDQDGPKKKILLITSRDTGRWILPKGWPIDGLDAAGAAVQEAWEEAGVTTSQEIPEPMGQFTYDKTMDSGGIATVEAHVFAIKVDTLEQEYPESGERSRKWVSPTQAADMVAEPELRELLRNI